MTTQNSWDLALEDVPLGEFFEVQLVNVFAPWAFTARLQPLMRKSRFSDRYVVQVSAIEGQFDGPPKTGSTRTRTWRRPRSTCSCAQFRAAGRDGIYMNAVDPGWVSDQSAIARRSPTSRFCPPLIGSMRSADPRSHPRGMRGDIIYRRVATTRPHPGRVAP